MKKYFKILSIFFSLIFLTQTARAERVGVNIKQLAGKDRYETALLLSQESYEFADQAILVNGKKNADLALAATLQAKLNCPILLTRGIKLEGKISQEIKRLGVKKVYLIGGLSCITEPFEKNLSKNYNVTRYGGADRFETSVIVSKAIDNKEKIFLLLDAYDNSDMMKGLRWSRPTGIPFIYINKDGGPKKVIDEFGTNHKNFILNSLTKYEGRFKDWKNKPKCFIGSNNETTLEFLNSPRSRYGFSSKEAVLVNIDSFSDSILTMALVDPDRDTLYAGKHGPIYFVKKDTMPEWVKTNLERDFVKTLYLVGGENVITFKNLKIERKVLSLEDLTKIIKPEKVVNIEIRKDTANGPQYHIKQKEKIESACKFPGVEIIKLRSDKIKRENIGMIFSVMNYFMNFKIEESDEDIELGFDLDNGLIQLVHKTPQYDRVLYRINPDDIPILQSYFKKIMDTCIEKSE